MKKKIIITLLIIMIVGGSIYLSARYIGTKGLKVKEYKIETNITENFHGLKIVHFSDLLYKSTINLKELDDIADKINLIKPDIIVFTGNLVSKNLEMSTEIENDLTLFLNKVKAVIGKYAVTGENDNEKIVNIMKNGGFNILSNNYELIYKDNDEPIMMAGINYECNIDEEMKNIYDYLDSNEIQYKILLMHKPDNIDKISNFNLVLSGHSLNNQINIPVIRDLFKLDGSKKYYNEYYEINNKKLFISSGLGTSEYHLRLFNKPSFNFYRIVKES